MDTVWVALILGVMASIVSPVLLSFLTAKQNHRDKAQDYARQDEVATRLTKRQDEIAEKLLIANRRVASEAAAASLIVNGKLNQIHDLVNSTMTAAMESELLALQQQHSMMGELDRSQDLINAVQDRIDELQSKLSDRAAQTEIAQANLAKHAAD